MTITGKVTEKGTIKYYFHTAIVLFLMFGMGFVPSFNENITQVGMISIGVFLGMLYGWTFVEMIWPSLLGMVAVCFTGVISVKDSFLQGFGADIVIITLLIFIFSEYLNQSGLNRYVAEWFISRKICIGRPWILCGILTFCAFLLSVFTYIFAAILVLWAIFYNTAEHVGLEKKSTYVSCILFGIVLGGALGALALPFNPMALIALNAMEATTGLTVNFAMFSVFNFVFCTLIIALYCLACKYLLRVPCPQLSAKEDKFSHLRGKKMNKNQKQSMLFLCIFLLMLLLPGILPKTWPVIKQLNMFSVSGCAALVIVALLIVRKVGSNGKEGLMNFAQVAKTGINWDVIILLAATMPVSTVLESDQSGVLEAIRLFLMNQISGINPYLAIAIIAIALCIVTQFAHNAVLLIIFIPMLCPIAVQFGINPVVLVVTLLYSVQTALLTPASSTQAAMLFANTEWVDKKDIVKLAVLSIILIMAVALCVVMPLAGPLLG